MLLILKIKSTVLIFVTNQLSVDFFINIINKEVWSLEFEKITMRF